MTKQTAQKRGRELLARMNNPEAWELDVWENVGWHYALRLKGDGTHGISLHPAHHDRNTRYFIASIATAYCDRETYADPNDAVRGTLDTIWEYVKSVQRKGELLKAAFYPGYTVPEDYQ